MPTQIAPTVRGPRRAPTVAALAAAALLAASCGTGEDSPAAEGSATAQETATSAVPAGDDSTADKPVFATVELVDPEGQARGTVEFAESDGGTQVSVDAIGLPPGFHGLHVHGVGVCEPDSASPTDPGERGAFLSAGGHLAGPDAGPGHPGHAGDLPTLYVAGDGTARVVTLTDRLDRDLLLDSDGSAVMVHAESDNFANIPGRYAPDGPDEDTRKAGDGGSRIACGALEEQR